MENESENRTNNSQFQGKIRILSVFANEIGTFYSENSTRAPYVALNKNFKPIYKR